MGCAGSSETEADKEQAKRDKTVKAELHSAKKQDQGVEKLLLLGAGGSGKSTFLKQLTVIHGSGYSDRELEGFKRQIFGQIIDAMQTLIQQCTVSEEDEKYTLAEELKDSSNFVMGFDVGSRFADMGETVATHLQQLWESPAIKSMFDNRAILAIPDSTNFFYDSLDRLKQADYTPSNEDILLVRYRTTGMTEKDFVINGKTLRVVDVGGQRNERKKWIHFFDNVRSVMFVASLTAYDEVPFEDVTDLDTDLSEYNNMKESLDVFKQTMNCETFYDTAIILFLNKSDIMPEKIKRVNITTAFPDYTGEQEFEPAVEYIKQEYIKRNRNEERQIFSHVTCATDTKNVESLFNDVQVCVVNMSLDQCGIV